MRLRKQLNINNTFRSLNLNFWVEPKIYDLEDAQVELDKDNYKIKAGHLYNSKISEIDPANKQKIYIEATEDTNYMIPINDMTRIGSNRNSYYMYDINHIDYAVIKNIDLASAVATTVIKVDNVNSKTNLGHMLFDLYNVKYIANEMFISFEDLDDEQCVIDTFNYLHEILARWTIQLYLVVDTPERKQKLFDKIRELYN